MPYIKLACFLAGLTSTRMLAWSGVFANMWLLASLLWVDVSLSPFLSFSGKRFAMSGGERRCQVAATARWRAQMI